MVMTVLITLVYIVVMVMTVLITLVYIYLTLMTVLITLVLYIVVMVMTVCDSFGFLRRQWVTKCQPNGRRKKTLTSPNLSTTTWKRYSSLQSTCYNTMQVCPQLHCTTYTKSVLISMERFFCSVDLKLVVVPSLSTTAWYNLCQICLHIHGKVLL